VHLSVVSDWLARALAAWPARDALRAQCLIHRARLEREVNDDTMRVANARRAADEALAIALELHDPGLEAVARQNSAGVSVGEGDIPRAIELFDEVVPMLGPRELGMALSVRCVLKAIVGDRSGAQDDIDAAFAAWARHGDPTSGEPFLTRLTAADVAFRSGDLAHAAAYLHDAIVLLRDGGHAQSPAPFEFLAHLAAAEGDHERALRLASFAERLRGETGMWPSAFLALTDRSWLAETQQALASRVMSIRGAGRQMSESEAILYALEGRVGGELTSRQSDVASLVAKGLSDKEIAARLLISERTAENHVQHIREKLGVRSRAQIGSWVASHDVGPA
jgi:non-specific serine/threonine protein kinase